MSPPADRRTQAAGLADAAWEKQRNKARARIKWMFTVERARAPSWRAPIQTQPRSHNACAQVLSCSPCQGAGTTTSCLFSKLFSMAAVGQSRRHDHETTVDHALMRELVIAGPVMRRGASSV